MIVASEVDVVVIVGVTDVVGVLVYVGLDEKDVFEDDVGDLVTVDERVAVAVEDDVSET